MRAVSDLECQLDREKVFEIYCNHSNLIHMFAPNKDIKQHVRGKLQRWALKLAGRRYQIEHIAGEDNLWADIISRWAQPSRSDVFGSVKHVVTHSRASEVSQLRPLQDEAFVWPTFEAIRLAQRQHKQQVPECHGREQDGLVYVDSKLWLPIQAKALVQRILIIAHCGPQGHRGDHVTVEQLIRRFWIRVFVHWSSDFLGHVFCANSKGRSSYHAPVGDASQYHQTQ